MPESLAQERVIILAAITEIVATHGYPAASVEAVCSRAGVSLDTFSACFPDSEHCFLAAFDDVVARGTLHILEATSGLHNWREQTRRGIHALLCFLDEDPPCSRLLLVESFGVSTRVLWRRSRLLDRLAELIHTGGTSACDAPPPPRAVARRIVSTVHGVIYESVASGRVGELSSLTAPLTSLVVAPYLGEHAAREELSLGVVGR